MCDVAVKETFDLGWLIQTGIHVLKHGIPHKDIFSWTNPDQSFTAYQWLSEVVIGWLYSTGGLWLVGLVACILSGLLYFCLLPMTWKIYGIKLPVCFAMMFMVLTPHFFNARPQLASYYLLLAIVWICEKELLAGAKRFLLIPIFLIWVNVHSFWLIGVSIVMVYLFCRFKDLGIKVGTVLFLSIIATTICNPYGLGLIGYLKTFVDGTQFLGMREVLPSWSDQTAGFWFAYLAICWGFIIAGRRAISKPGLLVCLLISAMAIFVRRYQSVCVIVMWLYVGQAIALHKWARGNTDWKTSLTALLPVGVLIPVMAWSIRFPTEATVSACFYEGNETVLNVYEKLKDDYKGFADPTSGSWLIGKGYSPVFIDTRYDMYPKEFCQQVLETLRGDAGWQKYLNSKNVRMVMTRDEFPLFNKLSEDISWFPAIDNGRLSIWVQFKDRHPDLELAEYGLQNSELFPDKINGNLTKLETAKTRCQWYLNTSNKELDQRYGKEKITDALSLQPQSKSLIERWNTLKDK